MFLFSFCWYDVDDDVVVDDGADADDDADDPFDKASRGDEHKSGSSQLWFNSFLATFSFSLIMMRFRHIGVAHSLKLSL